MISLNLPPYKIKLGGTPDKPTIYDILRSKFVALTPEEWVRQHFIHFLIEHKGYPAALLANEVRLQIGRKQLRADSVLYDVSLRPVMIIEYKAPQVTLTRKVFDQISAYNLFMQVDYLVVTNGLEIYCCKRDNSGKKYLFIDGLPDYQNI